MTRHLPLGSRLDRYVGSHFIASYGTAMLMMTGLFLVMDMASNLDDFIEVWPDGTSAPTSYLVRYYILTLPYLFLQVAPFVTLLAGMFTFNRMLGTNEVTAALAAGISARRVVFPVLLLGALLGLGMFVLREAIGRGISAERETLRFTLEKHTHEVAFQDISVTDVSGSPALIGRFFPAPLTGGPPQLEDIKVITRDKRRGGRSDYFRVEASAATWNGEHWVLKDGVRSRISAESSTTALQTEKVPELIGYRLEPEVILSYRRAQEEPLELSFSEVRELMRREPADLTYQTLWHYHLTFPLANVILLLVGLPLLFNYERGKGAERLALGGLLCIFYYAFDFVFRTMGLSGGFSPVLAAWVPVLAFGSLGVVLFDSMKS
ncbi:MAG: LptF/LptG family permease [Planctomycetota bacterium]